MWSSVSACGANIAGFRKGYSSRSEESLLGRCVGGFEDPNGLAKSVRQHPHPCAGIVRKGARPDADRRPRCVVTGIAEDRGRKPGANHEQRPNREVSAQRAYHRQPFAPIQDDGVRGEQHAVGPGNLDRAFEALKRKDLAARRTTGRDHLSDDERSVRGDDRSRTASEPRSRVRDERVREVFKIPSPLDLEPDDLTCLAGGGAVDPCCGLGTDS